MNGKISQEHWDEITKTYPMARRLPNCDRLFSTMGPPHNLPCSVCGKNMELGEIFSGSWMHNDCAPNPASAATLAEWRANYIGRLAYFESASI